MCRYTCSLSHSLSPSLSPLITDLDPHFTIHEFPSLFKRFPDPSSSMTGIDMSISIQKHKSTLSERLYTQTHTHTLLIHTMAAQIFVTAWLIMILSTFCGSYMRHLKTSNVNFCTIIPSQIIWSKTEICGGLFVNTVMITGFHKVKAISWLAEDLLTSWEEVWSIWLLLLHTIHYGYIYDDITTITLVNMRIITRWEGCVQTLASL